MAYEKTYVEGYYTEKQNTKYGYKYMQVSINVSKLLEGLKSGQLQVTDKGYLPFDIIGKQSPEAGKSTHYGVQSINTEDNKLRKYGTKEDDEDFDDLPF